MLYLIENAKTGQLAREDCQGEHDGKFTDSMNEAAIFETRSEAYDALQNFGPDWRIEEC